VGFRVNCETETFTSARCALRFSGEWRRIVEWCVLVIVSKKNTAPICRVELISTGIICWVSERWPSL